MKIILANNLRLYDISSEIRTRLMKTFTFSNPKWMENQRMGRWNRGTPKMLKFYDNVRGGGLWIPRGYTRQLMLLCRRQGIAYEVDDQRRTLNPVAFRFGGRLKPFQKTAVDAMVSKDF